MLRFERGWHSLVKIQFNLNQQNPLQGVESSPIKENALSIW